MRKIVLALALVFFMGGVQAVTINATKADLAGMKAAMEEGLKDASSAKLMDVVLIPGEAATWIVCGSVNAKNSYGGYAGYSPFMGMRFRNVKGQYKYAFFGAGAAGGKTCADKIAQSRK